MLATLTQLRTWLGLDAGQTGDDAKLTACLVTASTAIAQWCQREFEFAEDVTETFDGDVRDWLLRTFPVVAVTSVKYATDYDFSAATALTAELDYHVHAARGKLVRLPDGLSWDAGPGVWQAVYDGGYWTPDGTGTPPTGVTPLPAHITQACLLQAAETRKRMDNPGYKLTESLPGGLAAGSAPDLELCLAARQLLTGERRT